ncbi:hypothetical protein EVAR_52734_1 [Eumeta japonica]|uniref:Uncharacterized protein n=1 Tax=Eumeta variegata TaxID=151549 RepID=A0A4C1Y6G5_EUMVA|nr:hypothetical protein EVAR_52734_1 [Eumeta japonica]
MVPSSLRPALSQHGETEVQAAQSKVKLLREARAEARCDWWRSAAVAGRGRGPRRAACAPRPTHAFPHSFDLATEKVAMSI